MPESNSVRVVRTLRNTMSKRKLRGRATVRVELWVTSSTSVVDDVHSRATESVKGPMSFRYWTIGVRKVGISERRPFRRRP